MIGDGDDEPMNNNNKCRKHTINARKSLSVHWAKTHLIEHGDELRVFTLIRFTRMKKEKIHFSISQSIFTSGPVSVVVVKW